MANRPNISASFKRLYCRGDNSKCARYMVFEALGVGRAPDDLFPNQEDRAKQIIAESELPVS